MVSILFQCLQTNGGDDNTHRVYQLYSAPLGDKDEVSWYAAASLFFLSAPSIHPLISSVPNPPLLSKYRGLENVSKGSSTSSRHEGMV